jgi:hypothetical protein
MSDDVEMIEAGGGPGVDNWYPEPEHGWQAPAGGFNHERKRSREDTAERIDERNHAGWSNNFDVVPGAGSDYGSLQLASNLHFNKDMEGALAPYDGTVEEIPRVKMQTGCIPCLYVKAKLTRWVVSDIL